jgi:hypothetical protein
MRRERGRGGRGGARRGRTGSLEQDHVLARASKVIAQRSADNAGADDDNSSQSKCVS